MALVENETKTGISISGENLGNGVDIGGGSEVKAKVHLDGSAHDALGSPLHGVVQTGVDDVLLAGSGHPGTELRAWVNRDGSSNAAEPLLKRVLHALQQVVVGLPLVLERQASVRDVVQVLQPFEVRNGHTACARHNNVTALTLGKPSPALFLR